MNQQQALTTDHYETLVMFEHTEHEEHDIENNMNKMDGVMSIIHFSGRSLNSNLSKIKHSLNKFTIIVISETWLGEEKKLPWLT